jgi:uncharacterized protein with GYD domain
MVATSRGGAMATYISLINYTDQGIQTVKETVERAEAAKQLAANMGGTLREVYWTLGSWDVVAISEAPDDETATAFALALGSQGNIRTTTLRGFDAEEMSGILAKVG